MEYEKPKNAAAVALGRLNRGKTKILSEQEKERRRQGLIVAREILRKKREIARNVLQP